MPRHEQNPGQSEAKAARKPQALELRIRGLSYRRIAESLGVAPKTAYQYVREEIARLAEESRELADEYREIEIMRLDDATLRIASSDDYRGGNPKSVMAMVRISESRRKLLGIDAEQETKATSNLVVTIQGDSGAAKGGDDGR